MGKVPAFGLGRRVDCPVDVRALPVRCKVIQAEGRPCSPSDFGNDTVIYLVCLHAWPAQRNRLGLRAYSLFTRQLWSWSCKILRAEHWDVLDFIARYMLVYPYGLFIRLKDTSVVSA